MSTVRVLGEDQESKSQGAIKKTFDPLLEDPEQARYVLTPIRYADVWQKYKEAQASFWTTEEIDFSGDKADFQKLEPPEKRFLLNTLAFFAASDTLVNENLLENFMSEVKMAEALTFLGFQVAVENIHSETYARMLELFARDKEELNGLINAFKVMPEIKAKVEFARIYMDNKTQTFGERLVAFTCFEGILFSSSFASIYWLKQFKKCCSGLTFSNELISRDEGLHCAFGVLLFTKYLIDKPSNARVKEIVKQACEVECAFAAGAFDCALLGINADSMKQYIRFVSSDLCERLIGEALYKDAVNPFAWMQQLSLLGHSNFFEKRNSSYLKAGVLTEEESGSFTFAEEF